MTKEQELFIDLLSDHINERSSKGRDMVGVDFNELHRISRQQSLSAIIYSQLKNTEAFENAGTELKQDFARLFTASIFRSVNMEHDFEIVKKKFAENGIAIVPFKGAVIKHYYPAPELRTMGDVDFLIQEKDRQSAHQLMLEMGYECTCTKDPVWNYKKNHIVYEIHSHITGKYTFDNKIDSRHFDDAFEHSIPTDNEFVRKLEAEYQLIHLLYHAAKHLYVEGSGFRPFVDMTLVIKHDIKSMDMDKLIAGLERVNMYTFARNCFAFCEKWFGVQSPFGKYEIDSSFECVAVEKMFNDGVFGFKNEENEIAFTTKYIRNSKNPYIITLIFAIIQRFFPPYSYIKKMPECSFINGRPWLLPVAWIYRWIVHLRKGRIKKAVHTGSAIARRDEIEKRSKIITGWGL